MYCCGASGDHMVMLVADRSVDWSHGSDGWLFGWLAGCLLVDSDVWLHDAKEGPTFNLDYNQSCPCSYFCVVGWGPGGYSGIQEVSFRSRQES